jgi:hypothetical protein
MRSTARQSRAVVGMRRARKNHIRWRAADIQLRQAEADNKADEIRVDERYAVIYVVCHKMQSLTDM